MRCYACNCNLSDFEATRKTVSTGEFVDMCNRCYSEVEWDIPSITNPDLNMFDDAPEDFDWDDFEDIDDWVEDEE